MCDVTNPLGSGNEPCDLVSAAPFRGLGRPRTLTDMAARPRSGVTPHNPTPAERDERVSLAPLDPEEALRILLATPPEPDEDEGRGDE